MRFAKEALIGIDLDTALPGSRRSYEESQNKPAAPSFNADDLEMTPEMEPGPYFSGQDLMRDKYIRQYPGSGISRLPGGEEASINGQELAVIPAGAALALKGIAALSALKKLEMGVSGGAVNPGTIHDYRNQDPTTKYGRQKIDTDDAYMEIMKSGFI